MVYPWKDGNGEDAHRDVDCEINVRECPAEKKTSVLIIHRIIKNGINFGVSSVIRDSRASPLSGRT